MEPHQAKNALDVSRRNMLRITSGALATAALWRSGGEMSIAAPRHPTRGGTLRFATRGDASGLDPHRNTFYLVSHPLAATSQGLLDLNLQAQPTPGIAMAWDVSKDLRTYTFTLRRGVLFHNGRDVDAAAVQWNFQRIQNPQTSHPFMRSALGNLKEIKIVDKYTLRCYLRQPSAAFPSNVVYYPCNLIAPDSVEKVHEGPIGCGPFKFVQWRRYDVTELARFEHYFETDQAGNSLPYLDHIIGRPKKEDRVRLTALRTGEVDLIDNMAYTDAAAFPKDYAGKFQTWDVPVLGTSYVNFNVNTGPFTDKRLRQAAAHAVDRQAIKQAVFFGRGKPATGFYAPESPWYASGIHPYPAYDPDKAKFLLRQARAVGTEIVMQSLASYPYIRQTGELLQAMWTEAGFKVTHHIDDSPVLKQRRRDRAFHAEPTSASYRFDPDGWFSRVILSSSPSTQTHSGFNNARADRLIAEARHTAKRRKRLELYAEIEGIVNKELPMLYLHHVTLLEAGAATLQGYQPAISGAFSTSGAGLRTAWLG